jgi:hypothetical protein
VLGGHALSADDSGGLKRLHRGLCVSAAVARPSSHWNTMSNDMLGLLGVGAPFQAFLTNSYRGEITCCMLSLLLSSIETLTFQRAQQGGQLAGGGECGRNITSQS